MSEVVPIRRKKISWHMARDMWLAGKDTLHIAEYFGRDEAFIYNGLLVHGARISGPTQTERAPACNFNVVKHARQT